MKPVLSVVIPTYNEKENIDLLLCEIQDVLVGVSTVFEIIVVDDASCDGTAEAVLALLPRMPTVRILRRTSTRDLSSSIAEGFDAAQGDFLLVMDADFQHDPKVIPQMLKQLQENQAEIVVATRYADGGSATAWSAWRYQLSLGATAVARQFVSQAVSDPLSGFFLVRQTAWARIRQKLQPQGFKLLFDVLTAEPSLRCVECGYHFSARKSGNSKLNGKVIYVFARACWRLWWRVA